MHCVEKLTSQQKFSRFTNQKLHTVEQKEGEKQQATTVTFAVYYFQPRVKLHYRNCLTLLVNVNYGRQESPNVVKQRPNKEEEVCVKTQLNSN